MSGMHTRQRWLVMCTATRPVVTATGQYWCGWRSYRRKGDTAEQVTAKPCPQCGCPVMAVERVGF